MSTPKTLTADQSQALLEELVVSQGTNHQKAKGMRNRSMAIVMFETGIRVGELCGLRIDDLWFQGEPVQNLVVRTDIAKNKQERQIPISSRLREAIETMHLWFWSNENTVLYDFAFFTTDPKKSLTTRTVERIILAAGRAALNIEVTPHMLRHTFASKMMRKTNARVVQALLGHSSLQSTQIYMHPNMDDLKKAINGD